MTKLDIIIIRHWNYTKFGADFERFDEAETWLKRQNIPHKSYYGGHYQYTIEIGKVINFETEEDLLAFSLLFSDLMLDEDFKNVYKTS
jgi:hypothetical protein